MLLIVAKAPEVGSTVQQRCVEDDIPFCVHLVLHTSQAEASAGGSSIKTSPARVFAKVYYLFGHTHSAG